MATITPGFEKVISDDLILKVASSQEECELIAKFNADIHDSEIEEYVRRIYETHPSKSEILWFYIQDRNSQAIISSAALLPLSLQIGSHQIKVSEMAFVGTLPSHRGQGLFGIINDYYEAAVKERKLVLSILDGIPNYYRKYGYIFALEGHSWYSVSTSNISNEPFEEVKIRKATEEDINDIKQFYNSTNQEQFGIYTVFEKDNFHFRYMNTTCDNYNSMTYIIEEERKTKGFFVLGSLSSPDVADILLTSDLSYPQMVKILQFVKNYNRGTIDYFHVNTHSTTNFARFLSNRGAILGRKWSWQAKVLDFNLFFEYFKDVLEDRVKNSIFNGLNKIITISNYHDTIKLTFQKGLITKTEIIREYPNQNVDLRIPEPYSLRIFLSDRTIDELKNIITDTLVRSDSRLLIETLFPRLPSLPISYY